VTLDASILAVRRHLMQHLANTGAAPSVPDLAVTAGCTEAEVRAALRALADHHVVVLEPGSDALRMAHPFSAVPTPFPVRAGARRWWGNCIWDALGIAALMEEGTAIDTPCPDCADPLTLRVSADRALAGDGIVHFAVPAARWYEDIIDT
jgi:hypothetical protein